MSRLREHPVLVRRLVSVVLKMAVVGVLVGVAWVFLAPPPHGAVVLTKSGDRVFAYLGRESDRLFVSAAVMACLLAGVGVVAAVAAWQWRQQRGPGMVGALTVGGLALAGTATGVGAALARLRYGAIDLDGAPVSPESRFHYVVEAPPVFFGHTLLQILTTLLMPAAFAALTFAVMAAASAHDDLGAGAPLPQTAVD